MAVEPALNLPPPQIADHEMIRCIGKGSFGQVWLARNIMGEYRAVKVIYRATFETDRPLTQEFNAIKKYEPKSRSHPSLLNILHVGRNLDEGYFYYIMELADDQSASQTVDPDSHEAKTRLSEFKNKKRLPVDECIKIGLDLTEALDYLHQTGLIHRDIKLSNIIFVGGHPQLADVGLVTNIDGAKSLVGTEGYIPPEGPGSVQADIYALGKVLYEISTGNTNSEFPAILFIINDEMERKQFLALNSVFLKACKHDLKKRYKTAKEMHEALLVASGGPKLSRFRLENLLLGVAVAVMFVWILYFIARPNPPQPVIVGKNVRTDFIGSFPNREFMVYCDLIIANHGGDGDVNITANFYDHGKFCAYYNGKNNPVITIIHLEKGKSKQLTIPCNECTRNMMSIDNYTCEPTFDSK